MAMEVLVKHEERLEGSSMPVGHGFHTKQSYDGSGVGAWLPR